MYNILLGGAAGDGIETMSALLEKMLKQSGCHLFTIRDFMSRVRGGHNFTQIRFGDQPLDAHRDSLDGIFAIDAIIESDPMCGGDQGSSFRSSPKYNGRHRGFLPRAALR